MRGEAKAGTMTRYLVARLAWIIPVWLLISIVAFGLSGLAPGNAAEIVLYRQAGEPPTEDAVRALSKRLGLEGPLPVRYGRWLGRAVTGDLGRSFRTGESVLQSLAGGFPRTLLLALTAIVIALVVSLPLGAVAALRRGGAIDRIARLLILGLSSLPSFWLGYLLIFALAVRLRLLPVAGYGGPQHLILPAVTLAAGALASMTRLSRASFLDVLSQEYIRTARAKGLSVAAALLRHGFRNALVPILAIAALRFGQLLTGAVIVETIFAWPGIGRLMVDSVFDRDYPVIQGYVLLTGTVFVVLNTLVDLGYAWLDPRIRRPVAR